MICPQQHTQHLQRGIFGEALLVLPLDLSEVCLKLRKGSIPSLSQLADMVVELCHEAGVEYGFAQPHMKEAILEQADVLSTELASSLKVSPELKQGSLIFIVSESCLPCMHVLRYLHYLYNCCPGRLCLAAALLMKVIWVHFHLRRYLLASRNKWPNPSNLLRRQ